METAPLIAPEPNRQELANLGAILATIRPRSYTPDHEDTAMGRRIDRRLIASLTADGSPTALRLVDLLRSDGDDRPMVAMWADDLTAPHVTLTQDLYVGGAVAWHLRLAAAGVVYHDGQYYYWPDPDLDQDIPNMPITLGVDPWCLSY